MKRTGWSTTQLTLALYPLGWGAAAINLFFASLIGSWVGLPVIPPIWAVVLGAAIGLPASYAFARHIRALMDRVDSEDSPT